MSKEIDNLQDYINKGCPEEMICLPLYKSIEYLLSENRRLSKEIEDMKK